MPETKTKRVPKWILWAKGKPLSVHAGLTHALAAFWDHGAGSKRVSLEGPYRDFPGVAEIVLTDGTRLTKDDYYFEAHNHDSGLRRSPTLDARTALADRETMRRHECPDCHHLFIDCQCGPQVGR